MDLCLRGYYSLVIPAATFLALFDIEQVCPARAVRMRYRHQHSGNREIRATASVHNRTCLPWGRTVHEGSHLRRNTRNASCECRSDNIVHWRAWYKYPGTGSRLIEPGTPRQGVFLFATSSSSQSQPTTAAIC